MHEQQAPPASDQGSDRRGETGHDPAPPSGRPHRGSADQRIDRIGRSMFFSARDAEIAERQRELVAHLLVDAGRQHDRARLGQPLQARGDVDRVAEHVVVGDDDVAEMQADAEGLAAIGRQAGIALGHAALQLDRRAHRLDGAAELDQHAVADAS